jgi:hypothetical protein
MTKGDARERLTELLTDMDDTLHTNDDVRQVVEHMYAIASNVSVLLDHPPHAKGRAVALGELLRGVVPSIKAKRLASRLHKLADYADELEDYGDRSHYDELDESDIEEADDLRGALQDGLCDWLKAFGVEVEG